MLGELLQAKTGPDTNELENLGMDIGALYTDHGLPIDMALSRLDFTDQQKLSVLDGACQWFIQHKRNSGATDKSIERQRVSNKKMITDFIKKGEVGIY